MAIAILMVIASLLMRLQNPVALDDGLRHFAMGRLIAEHGFKNISGDPAVAVFDLRAGRK